MGRVMMGTIVSAMVIMSMVIMGVCMVFAMATPGFFFMPMSAASVRMAMCVEISVSHGFFSRFVY